jgi:predicted TIM-barrel fold metal-dependent hydrolase
MDGMDIQAIDIMNHAPFVAPGLFGPEFQYKELQIMATTTFRSMQLGNGMVQTIWGTQVPMDGNVEVNRTIDADAIIAKMDAAGYDRVVVTATKMWSHYWHHKLIMDYPTDVIAEAAEKTNGRIIGAAGYNPFRITESLAEVEQAVRDYGFPYVWFHPMTFGVSPNDRRCYPLYAKCVELGIPVGLQVGHSAEVLPSEHGRPMLVDDVAIEFPQLKINLSHTGWPWTGEFCSMIWRHPNVYGDISAYFAGSLDAELVKFMDKQGRRKILFGTNGLDAARCKQELLDLPISDKTKEYVLRQNAIEFLGL